MKEFDTVQGSGYFDPAHPKLGVIHPSAIQFPTGEGLGADSVLGVGDFSQSASSGTAGIFGSGAPNGTLNLPNRGNVEPLPVSTALALAMALRKSAGSLAYSAFGSMLLVPVWLGVVAHMLGDDGIFNNIGEHIFNTCLPVAAIMLIVALFAYTFGGILTQRLRFQALARTASTSMPPAHERAELSKSWNAGSEGWFIGFVILAGLGAIAVSIVSAVMREWLWLLGSIGALGLLAIIFVVGSVLSSLADATFGRRWKSLAGQWPATTSQPFVVTKGGGGGGRRNLLAGVSALITTLLLIVGFIAFWIYVFFGGGIEHPSVFSSLTGIPDYQLVFFGPLVFALSILITMLTDLGTELRHFRAWQRNPYRAYESDAQQQKQLKENSPEIAAARRILDGHPFGSLGSFLIGIGSFGVPCSLWLIVIGLTHSPLAPFFSGSFSIAQPLHLLDISPIIFAVSCALFVVGILVHAAASKARVAHDSAILRAFPTIDPIPAMYTPSSESKDQHAWAPDGQPWDPDLTALLAGDFPKTSFSPPVMAGHSVEYIFEGDSPFMTQNLERERDR